MTLNRSPIPLDGIEKRANKMLNKRDENIIYAIEYGANGWEKRTEIGRAKSKGIAWMFANSVLSIYKTVRIVYHDMSGTLIGEKK